MDEKKDWTGGDVSNVKEGTDLPPNVERTTGHEPVKDIEDRVEPIGDNEHSSER